MEHDFKEPKKINKGKIIDEIGDINQKWWKQRNDPALLKRFSDLCMQLSAKSPEVAESGLVVLRDWLLTNNCSYKRIHRYHVQMTIGDHMVDLKLNYHDFEFYLFFNDKMEKVCTSIGEVRKWLEERFKLPSAHLLLE
ncbi:hypothetical protein WMW72_20360 [Paenibacillus filicis]|uniref:Uncharacterized protein n=1 Tax=Paenibacillus filicis TaxID=669464 RepID=A0ABU9DN13_9BACL